MKMEKVDMSFLKNGNVNRMRHLKVRDNVVFSGDFPICIKLTNGMVWNTEYPDVWNKLHYLPLEVNIIRDKIEVAIALGYTGSRVLESEAKKNGIILANTKKITRYAKAHIHSLKDVVIEEL